VAVRAPEGEGVVGGLMDARVAEQGRGDAVK
jgi:hypothetical protein